VREDPAIELALIERRRPRRTLLIASGGCTALSLQAVHPDLALTLVDPNSAQLALVQRKLEVLAAARGRVACEDPWLARRFGIGAEDPREVTACGNFESLFRQWREFLGEFVSRHEQWLEAFESAAALDLLRTRAATNPYWKVSFQLFFADPILVTMFGPDAIQHAEPGSYPGYFQRVFERGLARGDARDNPWLHHAMLGHYRARASALPLYLTRPLPEFSFELCQARVQDVDDWARFDLISLSNVFDWMPPDEIEMVAGVIARRTSPGAVLVLRQLNHRRVFDDLWRTDFHLDHELAADLLARDRSLFYSRLTIATRRARSTP
jgi:S-adenosylmethionine-diacylglycerol 3-amino-3-carboxypropyl transferase